MLSPLSADVCDGDLVMFTCNTTQPFIRWSFSTPTIMNFRSQDVFRFDALRMDTFRLRDGEIVIRGVSYNNVTMELVSTASVTARNDLDRLAVKCAAGAQMMETSFISVTGDKKLANVLSERGRRTEERGMGGGGGGGGRANSLYVQD